MKKPNFSSREWRISAPWMIAAFYTGFPPPASLGAAGNFTSLWMASYITLILSYLVTAVLTAIAPLLAHRRSVLAILCAMSSFVPLNVTQTGWINFKLSSFIALLGVMLIVARRRVPMAAVAAVTAAVMPITYALYEKTNLWTIGSSGVVSGNWDTASHRYGTGGLYLLGIILMFALSLVLSRGARQKQERQEIENQAAEVDARAELARDLHDVVAHRISMVAVRAETAPYTYPDLDENAKTVLSQIASDAREALDEMRDVLGVLHRGDDQRRPQPQAADITHLFDDARAVGTDIVMDGALPPMNAVIGNVAYRLIQEALTNARRHAPGEPVHIAIHETGAGIVIRVENEVRHENFVTGRGLTGMRERVIQCGGQFDAHIEDRRFIIDATLPGSHV